MTWRRLVEMELKKIDLKREDSTNKTKWCNSVFLTTKTEDKTGLKKTDLSDQNDVPLYATKLRTSP